MTKCTGKDICVCNKFLSCGVFKCAIVWLYIDSPQLASFKTAVNCVIKINLSDFLFRFGVSLLTDTHQQLFCIALFYEIFPYWWFAVLPSWIWSKTHVVCCMAPFGLHCLLLIIRCTFFNLHCCLNVLIFNSVHVCMSLTYLQTILLNFFTVSKEKQKTLQTAWTNVVT